MKPSANRRSSSRRSILNYEKCEHRNMLATFTGTEGNDTFIVEYVGLQVVVTQSGVPDTSSFAPSEDIMLDGLGGQDTVTIIRDITFLETNLSAELMPDSADIVGFGTVSWVSVENQNASGINDVLIRDSVGDDQFSVNGSDVQFSGSGFDWTIQDPVTLEVLSSTGFDTAVVSGEEGSLTFGLDQFNFTENGATITGRGFANTRATISRIDSAQFSFATDNVSVEVFTDWITFSSPTHVSVFTLEIENDTIFTSFPDVAISGNTESNRIFIENNLPNGDTVIREDGQDILISGSKLSLDFAMENVEDIEIASVANSHQFDFWGTDEGISLAVQDGELEFTSSSRKISAIGFEEHRVFATTSGGVSTTNTALVIDSFDLTNSSSDGRITLSNDVRSVQLKDFDLVDLSNAESMPLIRGTTNVVVDYSNGSGILTFSNSGNATATSILAGIGRTLRLSNSKVKILPPPNSDVQLGESAFLSAVGNIQFEEIPRSLDVEGHGDSSKIALMLSKNSPVFTVFDDRVELSASLSDNTNQMTDSDISGFRNFVIDSARMLNRLTIRAVSYTQSGSRNVFVSPNADLVQYGETADFEILADSQVHEINGTNNDRIFLQDDANQEETLRFTKSSLALLGQRNIIANGYRNLDITVSNGENAEFTADIDAALINGGRLRFGAVVLQGVGTVKPFSDEVVGEFIGTVGSDIFSIGHFPHTTLIEFNDIETKFSTLNRGDVTIVGRGGQNLIKIDARNSDSHSLRSDRFLGSDSSTNWSGVQTVEVQGRTSQDIEFAGIIGDETFRFNDGVATKSFGTNRISVNGFGTIEAFAGSGNDVAYLAGQTAAPNTFVGNSQFGRLTTPRHTVTVSGFDLVSATATGSDDTATFVGTEEDEQFYAAPKSARFVSSSFTLNATGFAKIRAESGGGSDYANITDSPGDDSFVAQPDYARMETSNGESITVSEFPSVRTVSSAGSDSAEFEGSLNAERFIASNRFGRLTGAGLNFVAVSYSEVVADGGGGVDEAYLSDSSGNDSFVGSPTESTLSGNGFRNTAVDFGEVIALSSLGSDTAIFNGSIGNDTFYGNPVLANLTGERFFQFASGFRVVRAFGNGGEDIATLRDSDLDDLFFANAEMASLRNANFYNEVNGFTRVKAISIAGDDIANFEGSGRSEFFHGHRNSSYLEGDGFRNQVNGFSRVTAVGLAGADIANFHDSEEDERFIARNNSAWIQGETYRIQVFDFENVGAFGFRGGINEIVIDDPDFALEQFGTWNG